MKLLGMLRCPDGARVSHAEDGYKVTNEGEESSFEAVTNKEFKKPHSRCTKKGRVFQLSDSMLVVQCPTHGDVLANPLVWSKEIEA